MILAKPLFIRHSALENSNAECRPEIDLQEINLNLDKKNEILRSKL